MKIKNVLLLLIVMNCFPVMPLSSARAGAGAGAGDSLITVTEENAGEGSVSDGPSRIPKQDLLAKIDLLHGSLTRAPEEMKEASLLHGAMLWELGIVKMLYALLVTPKKIAVKDQERLVPDSSMWALGKVLMELFYMNGGTLKPSKQHSSVAYNLQPVNLGALYKAIKQGLITEWSLPMSKDISRSGKKNREFFATRQFILKQAVADCAEITGLNPKNLLPSIIMAFFWAKFVMGSTLKGDLTIEQAQKNIDAFLSSATNQTVIDGEIFYDAALLDHTLSKKKGTSERTKQRAREVLMRHKKTIESSGGAGAAADSTDTDDTKKDYSNKEKDLESVEAEIIARIKSNYLYNIPKPPVQASVEISPLEGTLDKRKFPDCGESGLRGLFCAAFYIINQQRFTINSLDDSDMQDPYSQKLRDFFEKYSSVAKQNCQNARNAWAALCSDKDKIAYNKADKRCDLESRFENVISLLAMLTPGTIPADCRCLETIGGAGATAAESTAKLQYLHNQECAKRILTNFCNLPGHNLAMTDFKSDGYYASWKIRSTKPGDQECYLYFTTMPEHMNCELRGQKKSTFGLITDPIFAGSDAISVMPKKPDLIEPLVFAAARMAQQQNFIAGYCALIPYSTHNERNIIRQNIEKWALFLPEEQRIFRKNNADDYCIHYLLHPYKMSLLNTVKFILENYYKKDDIVDCINPDSIHFFMTKNKDTQGLSLLSQTRDTFDKIKIDEKYELDLSLYRQIGLGSQTALQLAVSLNYEDGIRLLLAMGANRRSSGLTQDSELMIAAKTGNLAEVQRLIANGANPCEEQNDGSTPLMGAIAKNQQHITHWLLEQHAVRETLNHKNIAEETALTVAIKNNKPGIVSLLLAAGSSIENYKAINAAIEANDIECLKILILHKSDLVSSLVKYDKMRVFENAAKKESHNFLLTLFKNDPEFIATKEILFAAARSSVETLNFLLNHHEWPTEELSEAIYYATAGRKIECVKLLHAKGATLNYIFRGTGWSSLELASRNLHDTSIIDYLRLHGAKTAAQIYEEQADGK
jgi:ankyrin repeat protein